MTHVDPEQFIVTRKRKKYKFAQFANAANCFEFDEWQQSSQGQALRLDKPASVASGQARRTVDVVEIGAGTGLFCVELAARHPEVVFAAVDVKADRLQKGAYAALERGLDNICFIRARADQIDELFEPHSLSAIWLTFSDPFPKKRSAGRRMTHPTFLRKYANLLCKTADLAQTAQDTISRPTISRPGLEITGAGRLLIKHDNPDFFQWTLEQLVAEGWSIDELSFDLHASDLSDDYKLLTTYEQRWLGEGRTTQFAGARHGKY